MISKRFSPVAGALLLAGVALPAPALAWGHTGHLLIARLAMQNLPAELPAFVRTAAAVQQVSEMGAEADVSKSTGVYTSGAYPSERSASTIHDNERDAGHFIDVDEDGKVLGGPPLSPLLSGRRDFDTASRAFSSGGFPLTQYSGYLPYNMVDLWQQIRKDFAYVRAFTAAINNPATSAADRSFFQYQLQLRQTLTLRDIGYWSHFVGDASQPMHVSIHFNGWGPYPNPNNYTTMPIHARFEGQFVKTFVPSATVAALLPAVRDCSCTIETRVVQYINQSLADLVPVYVAAGIGPGADLYQTAQPAEVSVAATRLAAGAAEMRDELIDAWRQSRDLTVGFPLIRVTEIESGAILLTPDRFAGD